MPPLPPVPEPPAPLPPVAVVVVVPPVEVVVLEPPVPVPVPELPPPHPSLPRRTSERMEKRRAWFRMVFPRDESADAAPARNRDIVAS
jgi:hypothetical protein